MGCQGSRSEPSTGNEQTGAGSAAPERVLERGAYDASLRAHLLGKATPTKVEMTVSAAAVFVARAHHAQRVAACRFSGLLIIGI